MDFRQLTYAVTVADAGSFTAAARRCHISQSALSTQIAHLEAELGVRLFERTTRRVTLTRAGEVFLPTACRLLTQAEDLRAQMSAQTAASMRTLQVGSTQTATRLLDLPAALGTMHRRHPQVRITMAAGPGAELIDGVVAGSLDIALAALTSVPPDPRLTFQTLAAPEPLVAVVPGTRKGPVTLAELASLGPFIEFHRGSRLRTVVDALFRDAGLHRDIIFELGQIADVARCAAHGLGIAIVPRTFTAGLDGAGSVVLDIEDHPTLTIGAYTRRAEREPMIHAMLELFGGRA